MAEEVTSTIETGEAVRDGETKTSEKPDTAIDATRTEPLIKTLEARSRVLKRNAEAALMMIVVLLIGGSIVLYNIDEILGQRSGQLDISDATQQLSELSTRVNEVKEHVIAKDKTVAKAKSAIDQLGENPVIGVDEAFARLSEARQKRANIEAEIKSLQERRAPQQRSLRDFEDRLARIERDQLQSKGGLTLQDALDDLKQRSEELQFIEADRANSLNAAQNVLATTAPDTSTFDDNTEIVRKLENSLTNIQRERNSVNSQIDRTVRDLSALKEEQTVAQNRINEASRILNEYSADIAKLSELLAQSKATEKDQETSLNATRARIDQTSQDTARMRTAVERIVAENDAATQLINNAQNNLESRVNAWDADLKKLKTDADIGGQTKIWSSLGTRAALIVILLFLVQILVTLYRYNMRLASFYDARVDALKLAGTCSINHLGELIAQLSPEQMDFGKTPSSVTEQAFDLAKSLLSRDARKPGAG